ncbi:MAG: phosphoenolpyruvate carboxylase [Saprospiraceae bacterium]|jgi:phosphoenolpyruvate carboxylase
MKNSKKVQRYKELVENKYKVYNSLFMNLPYERVENIGMLIPLLHKTCQEGLAVGQNPMQIIDHFFDQHTAIINEDDKIDFFFRVIQYVERQVVLFDSVEDARLTAPSEKKSNAPLSKLINRLSGDKLMEAKKKLSDFGVRIVFTAHPTQFYPLSVLDIIDNLRGQISKNEIIAIDLSLQQLGMTSFINASKPTPFEEAKNIIYYLRNVYYDAIGEIYNSIKDQLSDSEEFDNPNLVKIGFWPGGDRDGNPFVTADTTTAVADELRMTLLKCYYHELKALQKKLTFKNVTKPLNDLRNKLYECMFDEDVVITFEEIISPLDQIHAIVLRSYNGLFIEDLNKLRDKVHIFKTHFATLDIRQDSSIHIVVVDAIISKYGLANKPFSELSDEEKMDLVLNSNVNVNAEDFDEPIIVDTIKNIKNLKTIQQKNGEQGCNRYIISNSEDKYAMLFVYALFRWCGYKPDEINFDIVPLFETMEGMQNSDDVMNTLFSLPDYRSHVERRGNKQTIMLGFSDGTKDGGYLRANWSIHNTKESLSRICDKNNVAAVFFDGRGGPPARGGGKTHKFYASQAKDIANNEIQLTIQGQTITSTYGTKEAFIYNVEQMITAGLVNHLDKDERPDLSDHERALMEELGDLSFEKYDSLKKHDRFIPYLEEMSTLKYYGNANIGSRPGKRGNKKQLTLSDLRAISFVGSWSQLKQNVPGYFGIGTAINTLKSQNRIQEVIDLFNEMPFFKALILNSMMSLTKSYFELTSYMKKNEKYSEFWQILYDEYRLSIDMLLEISGYSELMEEEPISKTSIGIREHIVLPLLTIQQYGLQKLAEADNDHQEVYEKIVTRSLYGNINASRNSA